MIQVGFALRLIAFPEVFDLLTHGSPPGEDYTAVRDRRNLSVFLDLSGSAF
jgi:hypothetical protein